MIPLNVKKFPPLPERHPVLKKYCPACNEKFNVKDVITLIPIGPGADKEARMRAIEWDKFIPVAIAFHYACIIGEE